MPESTPAALYGLYEVLSTVGVYWTQITGEGTGEPLLDVQIVSEDGKEFSSVIGTPIAPHASIHHTNRTDVIIAADFIFSPDTDLTSAWPQMSDWIRAQYEQGATVCSVCTGTVLLARAGLLDHQEATTHWGACDTIREHFPEIELKPERIVLPTGPGHRIITSGGASSWEDLSIYLVSRYCGQAEAIRTAKVFLFGDRSEGQLPFAASAQSRKHDDAVIGDSQEWVAMNYHEANPVGKMIARSGLADRTFKRRFRSATGYSPMDYVQTLRVEEAKQSLESEGLPIDEIAYTLGYEDPAFFRRLFKKRTGVTPGRYRQRFQAIFHA